ncbi:MAG: hypothetical protein U9Q40_06800, partial [Campylobacterota bacterium]|nr:hypothetical protein [Campylobacterota bacterium]
NKWLVGGVVALIVVITALSIAPILFPLGIIAYLIYDASVNSSSVLHSFKHSQQSNRTFIPPVNPMNNGNMFMSAAQKANHLSSHYWVHLKQHRLAIAGHMCECGCGCTSNLVLHHLHYRTLGDESINDVRILAQPCHQAIHDKLGYDRRIEYPIITKDNI